MSQNFELIAEFRSDQGKGASRRLRRTGKVPAILYGGRRDPRALALDHDSLMHQLENEAFFTSILTVTVDEKSQPCILKDLQRHPFKNQVLHVDLQRVLEDEKIRVTVPVHFLNEAAAPGVRQGGQVSHVITELEISCLPRHLPEFIEADIAGLEMDGILHVSELKLPEGVEIVGYADMQDRAVATVHRPRRMEEEEEPAEGAEPAAPTAPAAPETGTPTEE
jgi:large subunit ribosomal protein L25